MIQCRFGIAYGYAYGYASLNLASRQGKIQCISTLPMAMPRGNIHDSMQILHCLWLCLVESCLEARQDSYRSHCLWLCLEARFNEKCYLNVTIESCLCLCLDLAYGYALILPMPMPCLEATFTIKCRSHIRYCLASWILARIFVTPYDPSSHPGLLALLTLTGGGEVGLGLKWIPKRSSRLESSVEVNVSLAYVQGNQICPNTIRLTEDRYHPRN